MCLFFKIHTISPCLQWPWQCLNFVSKRNLKQNGLQNRKTFKEEQKSFQELLNFSMLISSRVINRNNDHTL